MEHLEPFCRTDRQREVLRAVIAGGSNRAAAATLGIDRRLVDRTMARIKFVAAMGGVAPAEDLNHPLPLGQELRGVSTLYHPEKGQVMQWVKTRQSDEARLIAMQEAFDAFKEDLPRYAPVASPQHSTTNLLNCFILTDYHLGMLAWPEETGAPWDLQIAADLLIRWFGTAISLAPDADEAVLTMLGDFLHWDGFDPMTRAHHNLLDADTRFPKLIKTAIRLIRSVIAMLLAKYPRVHVIPAEGNHDPEGMAWLRSFLEVLYEDEPRLTVDGSPDPFYCYEFGDTSLYFHHGHKRKINQVSEVFAAKFRDVWGRTRHSYAHLGHMHHERVLESGLMIVEQHRTLAAPDAYASTHGFMSGRDAKVITYHRRYGRVSQLIISPEMCEGTHEQH
jgi:hypothetical protein